MTSICETVFVLRWGRHPGLLAHKTNRYWGKEVCDDQNEERKAVGESAKVATLAGLGINTMQTHLLSEATAEQMWRGDCGPYWSLNGHALQELRIIREGVHCPVLE